MEDKDKYIKELEDKVSYLEIENYALQYFAPPIRGLCPKCKESVIFQGYKCFNCGYDLSRNNGWK